MQIHQQIDFIVSLYCYWSSNQLTGLALPHFSAYPLPRPGLQPAYVVVIDYRRQVIVDIG